MKTTRFSWRSKNLKKLQRRLIEKGYTPQITQKRTSQRKGTYLNITGSGVQVKLFPTAALIKTQDEKLNRIIKGEYKYKIPFPYSTLCFLIGNLPGIDYLLSPHAINEDIYSTCIPMIMMGGFVGFVVGRTIEYHITNSLWKSEELTSKLS